MRVVFMGTPDYATKILEGIEEWVVALFTQPDKPVGRKQILTPPDTKRYVMERKLDIPIYQPDSLKNEKVIETIRGLRPDFIVVAAYGKILPKEILSIAPCINLHASLLPKYRGASPIQQALLEGETQTGVTAMLMDERLDSGDILAYDVIGIEEDDTAVTLFKKLAARARELTLHVLKRYSLLAPIKQMDVDATYCKKIRKSDGLVDFEDAKLIYNKYRAFIHWPGIFLENGLKLKKIALEQKNGDYIPGKILKIDEDGVVVGCKRGSIKLLQVQPPSKKEMDALSYIRGKRLGVGDILV